VVHDLRAWNKGIATDRGQQELGEEDPFLTRAQASRSRSKSGQQGGDLGSVRSADEPEDVPTSAPSMTGRIRASAGSGLPITSPPCAPLAKVCTDGSENAVPEPLERSRRELSLSPLPPSIQPGWQARRPSSRKSGELHTRVHPRVRSGVRSYCRISRPNQYREGTSLICRARTLIRSGTLSGARWNAVMSA
jgi:hypothetical protein